MQEALIDGFLNQGLNVQVAGVIPTPAISHLTRQQNAALGVVISASHNPSEYNGIKFFNSQGIKLEERLENQIEDYLNSKNEVPVRNKGGLSNIKGKELYIEHLKEVVTIPLKGLNILLDCANGSASFVAPQLFDELGVGIKTNACRPDGRNINLQCGSTFPSNIQEFIKSESADAGFAFDGDADRTIAVDEKADLVDGDFIMAICAKFYKEKGQLKDNKLVTTVMTNLGFHQALNELGIKVLLTKVGDKYVLEEMIKSDANLGGEQSGHIIFLEHGPAGDGLLTTLKLLQVMQETGQKLSELARVMKRLPQVLVNVEVKDKNSWEHNERLKRAIGKAESELGQKGRILVRASGTEELIRVMTESHSLEHAKEVANRVVSVVKEEFC